MNFYISDTHFGHSNIIKFCNRPFKDVHHMNQTLTANWNAAVGPDDTVYHLGDFSMGQPVKYRERLNGKIILIKGNHDKLSQCVGHFDEIHDKLEMDIAGHKVLLCHYYYKDMLDQNGFDNKHKHNMPSYDPSQILIHGHCHNSKPHINEKHKAINVSAEWSNYTPTSEARIIEIMKEQSWD